jgi:hypothetical protein
MASSVDICNLALSRISQDQINSLDDPSPNARFCKAFFEQTRDEVLQSNPWRFASAVVTLTALVDEPLIEWDCKFQLPTDCLRVLELNGSDNRSRSGYFEVQANTLLTNETTAIIRYIRRETDGSLYPPLFVEALSCKLAARIAKPLTGKDDAAANLLTEYTRLTGPEARRMDAYIGHRRPALPYVNSDLVASRFGAGGFWSGGGYFPN